MDMAQRPVLVAMVDQLLDRAGGIGLVPFTPLAGGVQDADVEQPRYRRGILAGNIGAHVAAAKAVAVHGNAQILHDAGLGSGRGEEVDVVRHPQMPCKAVFSIMVAQDHENADTRRPQPGHAADEEQPALRIAQVTVKHVACQHHEAACTFYGQADHVTEGPA